uniref:Uncharacterized protein n=1 Tax=Panagrolaimus sp. PS1159 TaxID=55785 RepID=A0AC35FU53_9BILA
MSDSPDILGSPNSPVVIRDGVRNPGVEADLSVVVERRIWNLIQILSNCVGDLSKEKPAKKNMDNQIKALKECLADIETDLTAQLKIMEESLMSTDFNCCRALYDHQIETMDEMYSGMKKFLSDAVQRKDLDGGGGIEDENYPSDEKEEIDPADFPPPVLSMDPRHIGKSILRHDNNPEKNEDEIFRVRFDKVVRKRLFKAPAEEYEYPELYRLSEKLAFHKALKARNIDIDDLWESEGLLRAEGFALLAEDLKQRRKDKLARKLIESHKKPKRIETEKPTDYMSSSSSDSSAPGSVKSNASFLNSDSSELSLISEASKTSSDDEKQDSGEQQIGSHESITEREGDFSMPEDESSLQQPPSSTTNEEEDVEMGET